ncbi:MAG: peroxidase [Candidatus Eisenbacteria bacterium]|nr:peroxidase [Candidatus Eisenbacteria bacterium]
MALPEDAAAMLRYVALLTLEPQRVRREDVDRLREAGFTDRAVHDICVLAAYFAFVNRTADGLGVELERDRSENGGRR